MAEGDIEKGKGIDVKSSNINIVREESIAEGVKNSITRKLRNDSPMPASCSIFRVPQVLRRQKEEAYTPDIVSIGPFHRGLKFEVMENVKHWYLQSLLSRMNDASGLDILINEVLENENKQSARKCYADPLNDLDEKEFVEMLVVDGCFLLELFRKGGASHLRDGASHLRDENDPIFNEACMLQYLYHDLLLLENQLPWFVLECLYDLIGRSSETRNSSSLVELVLNFLKRSVADDRIFNAQVIKLPYEVLHILDLVRTVIVRQFNIDQSYKRRQMGESNSNQSTRLEPELPQRIPCATSLTEAGVKFSKNSTSPCILNIEFKDGKFTIPSLVIDETTAPLFRNLIAYEQCHHSCRHIITSYAVLMDNLIDTSKDVELLCQKEILANWLNAEDAAKFFNDLYNDTTVVGYCYQGLCNDVNKYYNTKWHQWMEKLRSDYFSTPWAVISFIAAFVLLVLTLVQTIYAICHP